MFRNRQKLTLETAEGIAAQGLAFLADDPERLGRFLAVTGLSPDQIRAQVDTHPFLAAVLEYLVGDESLLLVFAANTSIGPETVAPALALLQQASGDSAGS
jgi:Protein of unknown function (DUF3572)